MDKLKLRMSLQNILTKFQGLPDPAKFAIGVGAGISLGGIVKAMFFSTDQIEGLPPASNLKGFSPTMNKAEAQQILNLPLNYSKQDIQKRHKNLMALHHPDKGGSPLIATKINEAKDFLLTGSGI